MPKSRKRHINRKNGHKKIVKPYSVIKQRFVKMENPFPKDIPFEKRIEILYEIGNKANIEFEDAYQKLLNFFKEFDPVYLCTFSAYYFLRREEGIDEEAINGSIEFPPFYLEIIQCIALISTRTISGKPLNEKIEDFKTTIKKLNENQSRSYLKLINEAKSQDDIGAIVLRTEMMIHTLAVRNWAYVDQMEKIAYDLSALVENEFIQAQGFNPKNLIYILNGIISLTEKKLNLHRYKTFSFFNARTNNDVFNRYENCFQEVEVTIRANREKLWEKLGKNLKALKAMLLAHSDYFLENIFTHSSSEICDHLSNGISEKEIGEILDKLSYNFGDLSEINKDYIYLNNPIHSRPFVKIESNKYFSIIPHMFNHLSIDLLETFISSEKNLQIDYAIKKGKYLEIKVEQLFRESFPDSQILSGTLWQCPIEKKNYENDLTVVIGEFAIIVECKSGTVTPPARRGATERLFKTLKELVIEPSEQAIRFQNYLIANKKVHIFLNRARTKNIIDSTKIKYYVPLGITLSNLGSIGCNLKKLIESKVVSQQLDQLAPSISLTDLEIIFEILVLEAEKIHYLSRRREFEAHINFQGDEMDLFGFYLDNGFNIGESEFAEDFIDLTLKSKELDPYFIGRSRGVKVKKPSLQKSKYWNDLLNKLEEKKGKCLMASYILLNLPKEDQIKYEKNLKNLIKMIQNGKTIKKYNWIEFYFGPARRQYAIAGFPYRNLSTETRNELISDITSSLKKKNNIRGFLVIGYNLDSIYYPYSVMVGSIETNFFDSLN